MPVKKNLITKPLFLSPLVAIVLNDKRLSTCDRFLLSVIIQLTRRNGYCFASNKHLAANLNCTVATISRSITKLYNLGYITKNYPNPKDGGRVYHRMVNKKVIYRDESFPMHPIDIERNKDVEIN